MLAPTTIALLLRNKPIARAVRVNARLVRLMDHFQALQREKGSISEANCPRAIPRAVQALAFKDVFDRGGNCRLDFGGFVVWEVGVKKGKSGQNGGRALGIAVFHHDTIEDFGWIQEFEPGAASGAFVAAEAAVSILHA